MRRALCVNSTTFMIALKKFSILLVLIVFIPITSHGVGGAWTKLADGFFYRSVSIAVDESGSSVIHALKIDPKKFHIDVVTADNEAIGSTVEEMAKRENALVVINGGFFTPDHKSIGLIVKSGRRISKLHRTSWWSVFEILGNAVHIVTPAEFRMDDNVKMALQAGPRLVVAGNYPKLKEGVAARSGVGTDSEGFVIMAVTSGPGITLKEFAHRFGAPLSQGGFACRDAMALDGGGSAQLYAKVKKFRLSLSNVSKITNGIAVFGK